MKITMILDFVCPYCYVGEKILQEALKKEHIIPEYRFLPYELVPEPEPQSIVNEASKEYFKKNIEGWAQESGIKINFPTINPKPRTSLAFQGLYTAEKYGKSIEYIRLVLEAYWVDNKDIGNISILTDIAAHLNIPEFEFEQSLISEKFKESHDKLNKEVSEIDFEVVPTFYVDEERILNFPRKVGEWEKYLTN